MLTFENLRLGWQIFVVGSLVGSFLGCAGVQGHRDGGAAKGVEHE